MNKEILYGIGGVIIGLVIMLVIQGVNEKERFKEYNQIGETSMHNRMMDGEHGMGQAMKMMTGTLEGKKGQEFDQAFLSEMIVHHQGAIDMANLALTNAERQEIKDLSKAIVSAQTTEIDQMKQWQQAWFK